MKNSVITIAMLSTFLLVGCGSDNASATSNSLSPASDNTNDAAMPVEQEKKIGTGYYVDAAVEGISFQCGDQEGLTDENGTFTFEENATCIFSIGDVVLREVNASFLEDNVTILEDNITVAQLLQNLDADGNASNGILIEPGTASVLRENNILNIPEDADILALIRDDLRANNPDYNGTAISREEAEAHLNETRVRLNDEGRGTQHDVNRTREEGRTPNFDVNETHGSENRPNFEDNVTRGSENRPNMDSNETHVNEDRPNFDDNVTRGSETHENENRPNFDENRTRPEGRFPRG